MPKIIVDKTIVESPYRVVAKEDSQLEGDYLILPLALYMDSFDEFRSRAQVGVWLDADEEPGALRGLLGGVPVIGVNFPTFFDGRSLSNATIIRRKLGFEGELRAIGDVRRDQLEQMYRCGISAFQMSEGQNLNDALAHLEAFTYNYQSSISRPTPLFRSRSPATL